PVPTGREEEWRFTPLRRLRGLQTDQALGQGKGSAEVDAAPRVIVELAQHGDPRLGSTFVPPDRVSARAFASFVDATVVTVPAGTEISEPTIISVRGEDAAAGAAFGHLVVKVNPNARAVVVLDHSGSATYADNVEIVVGDVAIRPEATGTDTYESNRNLVLTDGTRVDSVPNLEILTGEVQKAGHASTSGRLEDQHMFYVMARGIPFDEARRLIIRGFFGQLIAEIEVPELRDRITAAIEAE